MSGVGVAAMLLREGRTVHNRFGVPVPTYPDSTSPIQPRTQAWKEIKECDVFVWDEAPNASKLIFHVVDRALRQIMNNDKPMGGKICIFAGDFRQTLPIKQHANRSELLSLSIKQSYLWPLFKHFKLSHNKRINPEETAFNEYLIKLGNGTYH